MRTEIAIASYRCGLCERLFEGRRLSGVAMPAKLKLTAQGVNLPGLPATLLHDCGQGRVGIGRLQGCRSERAYALRIFEAVRLLRVLNWEEGAFITAPRHFGHVALDEAAATHYDGLACEALLHHPPLRRAATDDMPSLEDAALGILADRLERATVEQAVAELLRCGFSPDDQVTAQWGGLDASPGRLGDLAAGREGEPAREIPVRFFGVAGLTSSSLALMVAEAIVLRRADGLTVGEAIGELERAGVMELLVRGEAGHARAIREATLALPASRPASRFRMTFRVAWGDGQGVVWPGTLTEMAYAAQEGILRDLGDDPR